MGRGLKRSGWILALLFAAAQAAAAGPLVLIDPGHGGSDGGVKAGGQRESDLCLALAKDVAAALGGGLSVRLTRDGDQDLSLTARVELADQLRPAAFISLHLNNAYQKNASGPRIFVPAGGAVDDRDAPRWEQAARVRADASRALGLALARALGASGPRPVQTLKLGLFRGLIVPAALVETGFAGDASDLQQLTDSAARQALARRLAAGIRAYLGSEAPHAAP